MDRSLAGLKDVIKMYIIKRLDVNKIKETVASKLHYKSVHTSSFWCLRWFLLVSRFITIVVLFLPTSSSDRAKQHPTGLEESNQERLFGLGPVPPNDSSRFYVDTAAFDKPEGKYNIQKQTLKKMWLCIILGPLSRSSIFTNTRSSHWSVLWIYAPFIGGK